MDAITEDLVGSTCHTHGHTTRRVQETNRQPMRLRITSFQFVPFKSYDDSERGLVLTQIMI